MPSSRQEASPYWRQRVTERTALSMKEGVGAYVEAFYKGQWCKAEITGVRAGQLRVHHTEKGSTYEEWVPDKDVRTFS